MAEVNLGRIGFVNKGGWQNGEHKLNDVVTYQNNLYGCIKKHTSINKNILPTNTQYWQILIDNTNVYTKEESKHRDENIMFNTLKKIANEEKVNTNLWKKVLEFENIMFYNTIFLELFLAGRANTQKILLTTITGSTPNVYSAFTLKKYFDGLDLPLKALKIKQENGFKIELWTKIYSYDTLKCRLLNVYYNNTPPQNLKFFENFNSTTEPTVDTDLGNYMVTATAVEGYK